jgi:hypothetical protein
MAGRTLRKTPDFIAAVHEASRRVPRILEAVAGAEFVILRNPELGMAVRGTSFSSGPIHPADGVTFKIIYSFDPREVVFRALHLAVAPWR